MRILRYDIEPRSVENQVRRGLSGEAVDVDLKGVVTTAVVSRWLLGRLDDAKVPSRKGNWLGPKTLELATAGRGGNRYQFALSKYRGRVVEVNG